MSDYVESGDDKKDEPKRQTAASRYEQLSVSRTAPLERARQAAKLTIPGLMPEAESSDTSTLEQPFQSVGADGVNNLSAKLLLALFPTNQGFFRLTLDDFTVERLKAAAGGGQDGEDARAALEEALGKCERAVTNRMEQKGSRAANFEALQHLIVCGNGLIYVDKDGSEHFFPLDRYVVKRDLRGNVLEIVVKECLARVSLPENAKAMLKDQPSESPYNDNEKNVDLYTWVCRQPDGSWTIHQEVEGSTIPDSKGTYPKDRCAWLPLRWRAIPGMDYGRGRVEEYLGDLLTSESLQQAISEFAVQASKVMWFVDQSGTTQKSDLQNAPNGAIRSGNVKDITVLMLEKGQDFQIAKAVLDDANRRLERAFLSSQAIQRNAERVTAEEIRAMIQELEQGLGGVYSLLAVEFQHPLAVRLWHTMMASGDLPQLPKDVVDVQIVTGMDGLSRTSDLQKLMSLAQNVSTVFGPDAAGKAFKLGGFVKRGGAALGIDIKDLVNTDDEIAQMDAAAHQQTMQEKLGPAGIKAATDIAKTAVTQPTQ